MPFQPNPSGRHRACGAQTRLPQPSSCSGTGGGSCWSTLPFPGDRLGGTVRPGAELIHPSQWSEPHCLCRNVTRILSYFTKNADRIFKILPVFWLGGATSMPSAVHSSRASSDSGKALPWPFLGCCAVTCSVLALVGVWEALT